MTRIRQLICLILLVLGTQQTETAFAESELEGRFQDMFVTAGYSAAAGAAVGAAVLTLQDNPARHLKFISIGASLGFLGGTVFGGWMALAPILVDNSEPLAPAMVGAKPSQIILRPWIDISSQSLKGVEAGAVLAQF
jgi:hypothetical protein